MKLKEPADEVFRVNQTKNNGLSSRKAGEHLIKFGPNQIFKPAKVSFFGIARHEITEPMILRLLIVGFFYSIWGELADAITIFVVIILLVFAGLIIFEDPPREGVKENIVLAYVSRSDKESIFSLGIYLPFLIIIGLLELKKIFSSGVVQKWTKTS